MIGDSYNADILGAINNNLSAILVRKDNKHNYENYSKTLDGIWNFIEK